MTRFKDFGSGATDTAAPPLSFALHGETFECVPKVQGKLLLDLVSKSDMENAASSAAMISEFFEHVLKDESSERFQKLLVDKDRIVDVETLAEIVGWLMGEYTNRPEGQPEVS